MLNLTGWHLDSDTALDSVQGNVLLTHHPKDGVLTVGCQSHQGSFKSADVVQLTSKPVGSAARAYVVVEACVHFWDGCCESCAGGACSPGAPAGCPVPYSGALVPGF